MISRQLDRIAAAGQPLLGKIRRGIEKESLRVTATGHLAGTPHPVALGSALTHPHITTDFSEAQVELITGVHERVDDLLDELTDIHRAVYQYIDPDERLWATSMPCMLHGDSEIAIGRYGSSNIGRSKSVYRRGLANRYGALMQTISGIHYNFSVPDALWRVLRGNDPRDTRTLATDGYFDLIRNFRRTSWLLLYLFGASPAVCASFVSGRRHNLEPLGNGTLHLPDATSLRMGRLGYQSEAQASLRVSYNSFADYAATLFGALTRPYPPYTRIGVRTPDGDYAQLNDCLLQIENEFYGAIRPKRRARRGERPLHALGERGVEYVEVRCLDLDPFVATGIDAREVRFLDVFLLYCLLADSPADSAAESDMIARNHLAVVERGRAVDLELERGEGRTSLRAWAEEILDACTPIAEALDAANATAGHVDALETQRDKVADASRTPSARILAELVDADLPFFELALALSNQHAVALRGMPLSEHERARFEASVAASHAEQAAIEAADSMSFDEFLADYLNPEKLITPATRARQA